MIDSAIGHAGHAKALVMAGPYFDGGVAGESAEMVRNEGVGCVFKLETHGAIGGATASPARRTSHVGNLSAALPRRCRSLQLNGAGT